MTDATGSTEQDPDVAETSAAEAQPAPSDEAAPPPEERLAELQAEADGWRDQYLRARADYDNLQKRTTRDAAVERERNKAHVLEEFLTVFEYCKMAEAEADKHPGPLSEGVKMVAREFERLLERAGVQTLDDTGVPFDATRHEAVGEETADAVEPGAVARVVRPGYLLGDRVLRFAKVTVAPQEPDGEE